ncbi:hypothetical protein E2C01_063001 [Portunus trituberculatus]|uniref:Uncharacterized protein n=1 Tax=Portunus trituberculatus TaxID=210409 RepID=A0A5B7H821_PORTR|nr:hypothetical protein [Portunus trituberculatus]
MKVKVFSLWRWARRSGPERATVTEPRGKRRKMAMAGGQRAWRRERGRAASHALAPPTAGLEDQRQYLADLLSLSQVCPAHVLQESPAANTLYSPDTFSYKAADMKRLGGDSVTEVV